MEFWKFYLSKESCKGDLSFDACKPVRALTDAVNKINSMNDVDGVDM